MSTKEPSKNNNTNYLSLEGLRNNESSNLNINNTSNLTSSLTQSLSAIGEGDTRLLDILSPIQPGSLSTDTIKQLISDLNPDMPESARFIAGFKSKYGLSKGAYQTGIIPIILFYMIMIFIAIGVYRSYPIKTQSPFTKRQFFEIIIGSLLIIFFYGFIRSILFGYPLMIKESILLAGLYILGYMAVYGMMYRTFKDKNQVMH